MRNCRFGRLPQEDRHSIAGDQSSGLQGVRESPRVLSNACERQPGCGSVFVDEPEGQIVRPGRSMTVDSVDSNVVPRRNLPVEIPEERFIGRHGNLSRTSSVGCQRRARAPVARQREASSVHAHTAQPTCEAYADCA